MPRGWCLLEVPLDELDSAEAGQSEMLFCGVWYGEWLGVDTGLPSGDGDGEWQGLESSKYRKMSR